MAKNDKQVKRGVYLYIDGKQINNDINSIDMEVRKLQRDIKAMQRGSEEYNRTMAKIQHLKKILRDHQQEIKGVTEEHKKASISVRGMVDWFNLFGGAIVAAIGFLTGVTLALRKFREERNKLETAQASLKALTGLDDDSISWLTEQAKTLSTTMTKEGLRVRQSAAEILDAFMLIGSAKPELLGDKEALKQVTEEAMRLQAAAGDIKLSEAVDSLTLSLNQYGEAADQAARYANVLAAGSQAGSANIASQASAIRNAGTAAASANVSIEQTVGLIETLAYRGIKDEVAGTGLKKFFLTLQTGADETNPKIVGLEKALENLAAKNMGAADIKKMFGEEGYNTASVLMQNTQMVKDYTKAVTDTNVATEQAAINSNTAAAALDQARNKMLLAAADLGDKLTPAFTISTNMATNLVKILPGLIDWFKEWGGTVALLVTPLMAVKAATIAWRLAVLAGNKAMLVYRASMIGARYIMLTLTGQITLAKRALQAFNLVIKGNPFTFAASALLALVAVVVKFATRASEAEKAAKSFMTQLTQERTEMNKLFDAVQRTGDGTQRRKELIEEINSKYGDYLPNLLSEKSTLQDIRDAYKQINTAMKANIAQKVLNEKTEEISRDMLEKRAAEMGEIRGVLNNLLPAGQVSIVSQRIDQLTKKYAEAGKNSEEIAAQIEYGLKQTFLKGAYVPGELKKNIEDYADVVIKENKRIKKVQDELATFVPGVNNKNELPEVVVTASKIEKTTTTSQTVTDASDKEKVNKEIEQIELNHITQMNELRRLYLEGQFESDKEYSAAQVDLVQKTLNQKLSVMGLEPAEREKIQEQLLESMIKFNKECQKEDENEFKEAKSLRERQYRIEIEEATNKHYRELTSEEDFQRELEDIRQRYYDDMLNNFELSEEERLRVIKEKNKEDEEINKEHYERAAEITREYQELARGLAEDYGQTLGEMIANGELTMHNFLKQTLMMALDALEKIVQMTIAEVIIRNLKYSVAGVAKAMAQIVAIKAAFAAVKGIVSNFYTGGYTPSGAWDQPQGIVHSDEFVANRFAVANPNLRPLFDAIDVAQKSGNVGKLTMDDVMAVSRHTQSTPKSSSHTTSIGGDTNKDTAMLIASVNLLNSAVKKLSNRLDKDINAIVTISGRNGVAEKMDTYNQMINNKKR